MVGGARTTSGVPFGVARPRTAAGGTDQNSAEVDLNQVVAYNLRAARELRGWTQDEVADRVAIVAGLRPTATTISALERSWEGGRRRLFNVQDIAVYAAAFDLPILWFLLPPPGDRREISVLGRPLVELYLLVLGRDYQLGPVFDRIREIGYRDPTPVDEAFERISGEHSPAKQRSYRERRRALLHAALEEYADRLDEFTEEYFEFFRRLRQLGIRGMLAVSTDDPDLFEPPDDEE